MCTAPQQPRLMRNYACGIGFDDDIPLRLTEPAIDEVIVEEDLEPDRETNDSQPIAFGETHFADKDESYFADKKVAFIQEDKVSPDPESSLRTINNITSTKAANFHGRAGPLNMFCS